MYKLTYFDIPARGEPARLIFAAAGVKFTDNRVKKEDWPTLKTAMGGGQLPVLEFGEKKLTQSKAIYRYLARKFRLAGMDEWDAAKCDELVDAVGDLVEEFVSYAFKEQDPVKKEEKKATFITQSLPTFLGRIDKIQEENGGTWLVGKTMTWADIVIAEFLRQLCEASADQTILNKFTNVRKMQDAVFSNENIKKYREGVKN